MGSRLMAGKSPVVADAAQRRALVVLGQSPDRGEADRARAVLLTLSGWTSGRIAEAFGVREDTVRLWRSTFTTGGVAALRTRVAPGPAPIKAGEPLARGGPLATGLDPVVDPRWALAVAQEVLSAPVADRPNWTLPRLAEEIAQRAGVRISPSRRWCCAKRGVPLAAGAAHAEGAPEPAPAKAGDAAAVAGAARRRKRLQARARKGAIVLLFGDESEALTHPYLAHVWAKKGADLRVPAPGQAAKVALLGVLDWGRSELVVHTSAPTQRRLSGPACRTRLALRTLPGGHRKTGGVGSRQRPDPHQQDDAGRS